MAKGSFYISLEKNNNNKFLGPYDKQTVDQVVQTPGIKVEVLPKIKARGKGLRSPNMGDNKNTLLGIDTIKNLESIFEDNQIEDKPHKSKKVNNGNGISDKKGRGKKMNTVMNAVMNTVITKDKEDQIVSEFESSEAIIITRYPSNIEWLREHGVHGDVVTKANPREIKGKAIVGIVPYRIGAVAKKVGIIDMPDLKASMVGQQLNTNDLYEAGARLEWFKVIRLTPEWERVINFLENDDRNFQKVLGMIK